MDYMACIINVGYVVVINGYPSRFFRAGSGLRQGCSLSPLLFILAMDVLSLHIKKEVVIRHFEALQISSQIFLSHSFFVDDILIMGMNNRYKWLTLSQIFKKFGWARVLFMNDLKSSILYGTCNLEDIAYIQRNFGVGANPLVVGMKYLGYHLKPCKYKNINWMWLVDRFHKKIKGWEF